MQRKPVLAASFIALSVLLFFVPAVSAQTPAINVDPSSGTPGTSVNVTGNGFIPNIPCDVIFGNYGALASFTTDANGGANASFDVPDQAPVGSNLVQVNCPQSQESASASFDVVQPPPATCQQLNNCTPTPTPSPTSTRAAPSETPTPSAAVFADIPTPAGPVPPVPLFGGRLTMIPPWVFLVVGVWLLVLVGFITMWVLSGRATNPGLPVKKGRRARPLGRKAWGGGALLWLLVGMAVLLGRDLLPASLSAICGIDNFPDLTPTHVEFAKSDFIYITISNIGPCNAPAGTSKFHWDTTEDKVRANAYHIPYFEPDTWLWVAIPALASGETRVIKTFWSGSYGRFHESSLVWGYTVDYERKIMEEDEYNNTLIFRP